MNCLIHSSSDLYNSHYLSGVIKSAKLKDEWALYDLLKLAEDFDKRFIFISNSKDRLLKLMNRIRKVDKLNGKNLFTYDHSIYVYWDEDGFDIERKELFA